MINAIIFSDINECNSNTTCHELAECSDTEGSYECTCNIGYEGDGSSYCIGELNPLMKLIYITIM